MDETVELNATLHSLINKLMDKYCLVRHFGGQQIKMCAIMALHKFLSTVAQIIFLSQDRTDRIGNMSDNDAASYQPKSYDIPGSAVTRRCAIPDLPNDTYAIQDTDHADLVKAYIPQHMEDGERKYNNCYFYSNETLGGNGTMHACNSWVYDKSQYQTSVTSDMNLVCDRAIFTSHVKTVFFVGAFIMFLIGGWISDKFGRKITLVSCVLIQGSSSLASSQVNNVYLFLFIRFLSAVGGAGGFGALLVYGLSQSRPVG
ncbi:SLC22A4_5 [Acanthosepion pharaonis]|uniref:SLC22A4_5 n=1 Tax=Acanthosepion pharaonis TaxID=158019 RepID=A0A812AND5_ACAPH|nr:SLC22A4_5 [Sepia pharaonis]